MSKLEFETQRLRLRQWQTFDVEPYAQICADGQVMQYLTGRPFDALESWRHLAFLIGHWQLKGFGHWAVEEKHSGELIGRIGFLEPAGWPGFEIGWTLTRSAWGKGYATEGAQAALALAFDTMDREDVISVIHPQNEASKNVARRLGQSYRHDTEINGVKVQIWGIDRASYLK